MNRRQLLVRIVGGFSLVALAGLSVPFLRSLFPSFGRHTYLDVDIEDLAAGEARLVRWLGRHVYIVAGQDAPPLVVYANCTHLGCEIELKSENDTFAGFRCPCHRSEFDVLGRVEPGSAARRDLDVPDFRRIGQHTIRLQDLPEEGA